MEFSEKTHERLSYLSTLGMVAGFAGAVYFVRNTPVQNQVERLNKEIGSVTAELVQCVPRDRKTSISDFCIYNAQRFDTLNDEVRRLEQTPAYLSARNNNIYSVLFAMLTVLSWAGSMRLLDNKEEKAKKVETVPTDDQP